MCNLVYNTSPLYFSTCTKKILLKDVRLQNHQQAASYGYSNLVHLHVYKCWHIFRECEAKGEEYKHLVGTEFSKCRLIFRECEGKGDEYKHLVGPESRNVGSSLESLKQKVRSINTWLDQRSRNVGSSFILFSRRVFFQLYDTFLQDQQKAGT